MLALYKIRFEIAPANHQPLAEVASECLSFIEAWVETSFQKAQRVSPGVSTTDGLDHGSTLPQLRRNNLASGAFFHSFLWRKEDDQAPRIWSTLIDLVSDGDRLDFQLQLGVEATAFELETDRPPVSRPRLIPTLLTHPGWVCAAGSQTLTALPNSFMTAKVEELVEQQLFAPKRELPVVIVTAEESGRRFPVHPSKLAERLAGTAIVLRPHDRLAALVLDRHLGPELAIGPYSIRVLAPGLSPGGRLENHWHYFGETIHQRKLSDQQFCDYLFRRLAARSLALFRESPLVGRYRELAAAERRAQIERARLREDQDNAFYSEFTRKLEADNVELEALLAAARHEVAQLRNDLETERSNVATLTEQLGKTSRGLEEPPRPVEPETPPKLVRDVVRQAKTNHRHLVFTSSALESADEVPESFKGVDKVKAALEALEIVASERKQKAGSLGMSLRACFEALGNDYKLLSDTAKNQWREEYEFLHRGKKELFEEHFTLGAFSANTCLSIHFSTKLRDDKIVVAYVGRHRRNTQT